ncbi:DUF4124 domain-containing protein [Thalassotalea sp. M1531]|uniref:DUF4124 domain-containing protein n=1 Tax=Thalassotalea algicola TaxID=2716224 RepID=A0A7Y0Q8L4_9GAMM|nr:DUF4124 domain-containing protein [Thalassotalea algicola]NMP33588.1 DUF4124 domain-containing protein [Thalassotalea algicola]
MKHLLFLLLATTLSFPVWAGQAKVYVWRDENGVLVFSDSPRPGAEEVKVKDEAAVLPSIDTSILDIKPQVLEDKYEVVVTQPEQNATIRDNSGSVYVAGGIRPVFKRGFRVQLFLDGKPYNKPQTHSMFALRNIDRGEHQIKIELINEKGKVIASSEPVTFYMHRASVN